MLIRCIKSQFIKLRRSYVYPICLGVPALYTICLILILPSRVQIMNEAVLLKFFWRSISLILPLLAAILSGLMLEKEREAGSFQRILSSSATRSMVLGASVITLSLISAVSLGLAISGHLLAAGIYGAETGAVLPYIRTGVSLWLSAAIMYIVYSFFSVKWGMGIVSMIGFGGILLSALADTAMLDQIWPFVIFTWPCRLSEAVLGNQPVGVFSRIIIATVIITLIFWISIWFNYLDHGKSDE